MLHRPKATKKSSPGTSQNTTCPPIPKPFPAASSLPLVSTLPNPLLYFNTSTSVTTKEAWSTCRQPETLAVVQEYMYGALPDPAFETVTASLSGSTLTVNVAVGTATTKFDATVSLPKDASAAKPAPVMVSIGGIGAGDARVFTEKGVAVIAFEYARVAADGAGGVSREGCRSRLNVSAVGVTGCSRLGKAALAASFLSSLTPYPILLAAPLSSGIQGAVPYRYTGLSGQGETLENSKSGAPWWTNSKLGDFVNQSKRLPFDSHTIAAAMAPRWVVFEQGSGDPYTDSKGTAVLAYPAVRAVYSWLGVKERVRMAIRSGGHCDAAGYTNILPFVEKALKGTSTTRNYDDLKPWTEMKEAYPWAQSMPS